MLDTQQLDHLAHLARLELTSEEKAKFAPQLSSVLGYFEKLKEVDTAGIEPLSQSIELENVARPDEVRECESGIRDKILKNFPHTSGDYLKTNKIL